MSTDPSNSRNPLKVSVILIRFLTHYLIPFVDSEFDLCNPEGEDNVYRFKTENCPYGVLFAYPVTAGCMASSHATDYYFSDICDENNYLFDMDARPYKVHLAFGTEVLEIEPESSCASVNFPGRCNTTQVTLADQTNFQEPDRSDPCNEDFPGRNLVDDEADRPSDPKILEQTERLFKYMTGLIPDSKEGAYEPRIVKVLKLSFEILKLQCNTKYVPQLFTTDILKAFLYVFRDSDMSAVTDLAPEDFDIVYGELVKCKNMQRNSIKILGQSCRNCSYAHAIEKDNQTVRYAESDSSFSWGRYDVVVDAIWSVLRFTHGLCFGTFKLKMEPLFQQAAEKLITHELKHRWNHPPELHFEGIWDHMLSAPVRTTMRNLDVCVEGAYANSPMHRLERPIKTRPDQRKKRSLPTINLDKEGSKLSGWCFQTREDLLATTAAYVRLHCPEVRKPLEDLRKFDIETYSASEKSVYVADGIGRGNITNDSSE